MNSAMFFLIAGLIGGAVGLIELRARYREEGGGPYIPPSGIFYLLLNALAAVIGLWFMRLFEVDFRFDPDLERDKLLWAQTIAGGMAAMVLLRSAIIFIRIDYRDIAIGPMSLLSILLETIDKDIDRSRARKRAERVKALLQDTSYETIKDALPLASISLIQNASEEQQKNLMALNRALEIDPDLDDRTKAYSLGLGIMDILGEDVLSSSIKLARSQIRGSQHSPGGQEESDPFESLFDDDEP